MVWPVPESKHLTVPDFMRFKCILALVITLEGGRGAPHAFPPAGTALKWR